MKEIFGENKGEKKLHSSLFKLVWALRFRFYLINNIKFHHFRQAEIKNKRENQTVFTHVRLITDFRIVRQQINVIYFFIQPFSLVCY